MINYILINVMLTCGALTINHTMKIPHRIRFCILTTALIGWLIPFHLMTIKLKQQTVSMLPVQWIPLTEPVTTNPAIMENNLNFMVIIWILMIIGILKFIHDLYSSHSFIKKLIKRSRPLQSHENVRLSQGVNNAFVSGYFKPIIWIDEQLEKTHTLNTVITHEQQHIKNHDQYWLLMITFIQRLFWFNPLVLFLVSKTRKAVELSCDEACKKKIGKNTYQSHLAHLIMMKNQSRHVTLNNQIKQDKNFNIDRIKQLNQENIMTTSHKTKLSLCLITALLLSALSLVTVASGSEQLKIDDNQVLLTLKIQKDDKKPSEMSILTNKGEKAGVTYDSHNFEFITHVSDKEPTQIYTEIFINAIEDGIKTEIANPSVVTTNTQWSGFKFGKDDTYFDIAIMAKTSSNMDPLAEATDQYIKTNSTAAAIIEPQSVPQPPPAPAPKSAPSFVSNAEAIPTVPKAVRPSKPVAAPKPHSNQ